jgi:hypothetical protein
MEKFFSSEIERLKQKEYENFDISNTVHEQSSKITLHNDKQTRDVRNFLTQINKFKYKAQLNSSNDNLEIKISEWDELDENTKNVIVSRFIEKTKRVITLNSLKKDIEKNLNKKYKYNKMAGTIEVIKKTKKGGLKNFLN